MISIRPLKIMMIDHNMNFTELANEIGVSSETIYRMKSSKGISMSTIDKICKYFNCGVGDIIEFREETSKKEDEK